MSDNSFFKLIKEDSTTNARLGELHTDHGIIPTPIFMPVGTQGTVKAVQQRELVEFDAKIILGNTYHLYLRPGMEVLNHFGGLHKFMNWDRPILTDSGGYQVFSLSPLRKLTREGAKFKSHIDGSSHIFTPENVVDIQRTIGSDIMMVLDECAPYPAERKYIEKSIDLSLHWAERARKHFLNTSPYYEHRQFQFGIGQGGVFEDYRKQYIEKMVEIGFDGYAIGGLSVGEPKELMHEMTAVSTELLPKDKPRYLMGVGMPQDILNSIEMGIDMFDCVIPTRNARNAQLFTTRGKINVRNLKHRFSDELIDEELSIYPGNTFTLGYLRHLFIADELLALQVASQHNIAFYLWLVRTAREKIADGTFRQWKTNFLNEFYPEK
ncbi:MAG: tRNA guanosine(34) transglycosylase Tgt [Ignavibacteria bacterium GWF2_33_9]|nr:MAG: tRNA guanosine(34) transglycosylase Tgt [Ignavibacteria bacterium GWF2_33_9]